MGRMTTGNPATGEELDEALARAIRQLISDAIAADDAGEAGGAAERPESVVPAA